MKRFMLAVVSVASAFATQATALTVGDIFVAESGNNGLILRIDPITGSQSIVTSGGFLSGPTGMTFDANGNLLVTDGGVSGGAGGIVSVDPVTGTQTIVSSGGTSSGGYFQDPRGIVVYAPVPIPAAVWLFGSALGLLAWMRRRFE